jgi:hypothetical protein
MSLLTNTILCPSQNHKFKKAKLERLYIVKGTRSIWEYSYKVWFQKVRNSNSDIQSFNKTKTLMECPTGYRDDAISDNTTTTPSTSRRFSRRASAEREVGGHINGSAEHDEQAVSPPPPEQPELNDNETSSDG